LGQCRQSVEYGALARIPMDDGKMGAAGNLQIVPPGLPGEYGRITFGQVEHHQRHGRRAKILDLCATYGRCDSATPILDPGLLSHEFNYLGDVLAQRVSDIDQAGSLHRLIELLETLFCKSTPTRPGWGGFLRDNSGLGKWENSHRVLNSRLRRFQGS
jgi:hypothetical protein